MSKEERYKYHCDNYDFAEIVYDNREKVEYDDMKIITDILNQQDQQIAQLKEENEKLKKQLALTEKALKLAREYMFNVMCADDVPFESWFIECAKNDWKPS